MRKLKSIFALLFAAFFLLAANGVNLIDYCCNRCKDRGIEAITAGCGKQGAHKHHCHEMETSCAHDEADACSELTGATHQCQLKRYTLDDEEFSDTISPKITMTTVAIPHVSEITACLSIPFNNNFSSTAYFHDSGRSLLSHICVLTI